MKHRESDFHSENFNEKFVSHCFRNSHGRRQSLASIYSVSPEVSTVSIEFIATMSYLSVGGFKLKDNVFKFRRFEVCSAVQIEVITWQSDCYADGGSLMLKLYDLFFTQMPTITMINYYGRVA